MSDTSILVAGVGGRMGRAIASEVLRTPGAALAGGFERPDGADIGKDIGVLSGLDAIGLKVEDAPAAGLKRASALIDFTAPEATLANARAAAAANVAHVIGTTGFDPAQEEEIEALSQKIPIVKSGNMSAGVTLLTALVEMAARALDNDYDIEIFEAHHRFKVDAPSGTALMLGEAAAVGRDVSLSDAAAGLTETRAGARRDGDIGFSVSRGGGVVGEHSVSFASDQEIVTLSHSAIDRGLFAKGAVRAAQWAIGSAPGLYSMRDVLGIPG
ncbi:MAG: 4-hydroxy-tetrahydrodipicolinate reductase [Pseudomonadota bacterium]